MRRMFLGCCERCKPAICAPFIFLLPGGQASWHMCQFAVIISICSHFKRLANPRSHASSAPRIICVCFLTQRRDCVNLLRGKDRANEMNKRVEKEGKGESGANVLIISKIVRHGHLRQKTRDK